MLDSNVLSELWKKDPASSVLDWLDSSEWLIPVVWTLDPGRRLRMTPPPSDDEVLVRVEGVSKKFCRSLKKSLWYGVCDIGAELNPFRRRVAEVAGSELLVASRNTSAESGTGAQGLRGGRVPQAGPKGFAGRENSEPNRAAGASGPVTSYPPLVTSPTGEASLRPGEFFAVKDVSFELRRGGN